MLAMGTGAEIRQPLGFTIVGGLAVSQLLTLYTTPVVYIYLDRLSQFVGAARNTSASPLAHSRSLGDAPKFFLSRSMGLGLRAIVWLTRGRPPTR